MLNYCVKCGKDTENVDPKMVKAKNNRLVMQSKCLKSQDLRKNRK